MSGTPFSSVSVNVTDTSPAGSDATAAPRISLTRPAPATCVGGGVGEAVGVCVDAGPFEPPSPQPARVPMTRRTADRIRTRSAVGTQWVSRRLDPFIAPPSRVPNRPRGPHPLQDRRIEAPSPTSPVARHFGRRFPLLDSHIKLRLYDATC